MRILLLLFASSLILSCSSNSGSQPPQSSSDIDLNEFYAFYHNFHIDSAFQMAHINFPLQGLPANADSHTIASGNFLWQEDEWRLHRPVDYENSEYQREIIPLSEDVVVEKITHRNGQTGMLRRFARMGDDWYLIYFADLNRIKRN
jgi:hypothetical protein